MQKPTAREELERMWEEDSTRDIHWPSPFTKQALIDLIERAREEGQENMRKFLMALAEGGELEDVRWAVEKYFKRGPLAKGNCNECFFEAENGHAFTCSKR